MAPLAFFSFSLNLQCYSQVLHDIGLYRRGPCTCHRELQRHEELERTLRAPAAAAAAAAESPSSAAASTAAAGAGGGIGRERLSGSAGKETLEQQHHHHHHHHHHQQQHRHQPARGKDKGWAELNVHEQHAVETLGWDRVSWDDGACTLIHGSMLQVAVSCRELF
jgi:hypothetical protein